MQGKLDGYRSEVNKGKNLNEDQQLAVSKYDEVSVFLNCKLRKTRIFEN